MEATAAGRDLEKIAFLMLFENNFLRLKVIWKNYRNCCHIRVVSGRLGQARTRKYKLELGPNLKTNLKPKSCPKKNESYCKFGLKSVSVIAKLF